MATPACIAAIKAAAPGIDDATAARIDDAVAGVRRRLQGKLDIADLDAAVMAEARAMGEDDIRAAMIEKRNRLKNAEIRAGFEGFKRDAQAAGLTEGLAISARLVGSQVGFRGAGLSAQSMGRAIGDALLGPVKTAFRKLGVLDLIRRGDTRFEDDLAHELVRLHGGQVDEARPPASKLATDVAEVLFRAQETARLWKNDAGAWIDPLKGWGWRQSHSIDRLAGVGAREWMDFVRPLLAERTYRQVDTIAAEQGIPLEQAREAFLRAAYENVSSGDHLKVTDTSWDKYLAFSGNKNLAKSLSRERSLIFDGAAAQLAYHRRFGEGSVVESIVHGLMQDGQAIGLLRTFGTNPEAMLQSLKDSAMLSAKALEDPRQKAREVRFLQGQRVDNELAWLTGAANVPSGPGWIIKGTAVIKAWNQMTKLGGAVLSSLNDFGNRAAVLRHNGLSLPEAWASSLEGHLALLSPGEKREVADMAAFGLKGWLGHLYGKLGSDDVLTGRMARWVDTFHKLSGLTPHTDGLQVGTGLMLARNLAQKSALAWDQLDDALRTSLLRYDIGPQSWELMRRAGVASAEGERFLVPEQIRSMDPQAFAGLAQERVAGDAQRIARRLDPASPEGLDATANVRGRRLEAERESLASKLQAYLGDQAREATNEAGAREHALVYGQLRPGDPRRAAIELIAQFKMYPLTVLTRQVDRELHRNGSADAFGLAHLIISSTLMGYASSWLKDLAAGRTQSAPKNAGDVAKLVMNAMAQGGGLGLYGDFLFGEYDRYGASPIERLTGPSVATVGDAFRIWAALREGEDPGAKAIRFVAGQVPGNNLFYTRYALDSLLLWQLYETVSPGYLRRMERAADKRSRDFIVPPSTMIPRGGGDRVFEGWR